MPSKLTQIWRANRLHPSLLLDGERERHDSHAVRHRDRFGKKELVEIVAIIVSHSRSGGKRWREGGGQLTRFLTERHPRCLLDPPRCSGWKGCGDELAKRLSARALTHLG